MESGKLPAPSSVGLLVVGRPEPTGEPHAILQIRGQTAAKVLAEVSGRTIRKFVPESYRGSCQVTAHGGLERGEGLARSLRRELGEELAPVLAAYVAGRMSSVSRVFGPQDESSYFGAPLSDSVNSRGKRSVTYGMEIPLWDFWDMVRWAPESGGGKIVSLAEWESLGTKGDIFPLDPSDPAQKARIFRPGEEIAMFPDEISAVKEGFRRAVLGILSPSVSWSFPDERRTGEWD